MHKALIDRRIDEFHHQKLNCAEVVLLTAGEILGVCGAFCPRIATPFGGGMAGTQHTCGALSGALMVVGLMKGREPGGDKAPAYDAGKDLLKWFEARFGSCAC
ncbi:MAG: C_GCAxxG_C_C family protein, partial [Clostridiales bacterium]|nr:C_GCAxxG_C_C family protein [Clostridiales bacterium]